MPVVGIVGKIMQQIMLLTRSRRLPPPSIAKKAQRGPTRAADMPKTTAVEEHFGGELVLTTIGRAADKPQLLVRQRGVLCQVPVSVADGMPQLVL